jgi:hypothetical protein
VVSQQIQARDEYDDLPIQASSRAAQRYQAVINFCKHHLTFGTHYSVLPREEWKTKDRNGRLKSTEEIMNDPSIKKFLAEPGADMLLMSWQVMPEFIIQEQITDFGTPRFYYRYKCRLRSPGGKVVAEAEGSASSEESGFSTRWMTADEIRQHPHLKNLNLDALRSRELGKGQWAKVSYAVQNPDLRDQMHNVNLRAQKRAKVKAVRSLFCIGDLFNQPIDDWGDDQESQSPEEEPQVPITQPRTKEEQTRPTATPKAIARLQKLFWERCEMNGVTEKADIDQKIASMFGDLEFVGWTDITSAERGKQIEDWIEKNLPGRSEQQGIFK